MEISHQVMATEAVLHRANKEIIRAHMKGCVADAIANENGDEKIDELMDILDKFSR